MKHGFRKEAARQRAELYAPRPTESVGMYGLLGGAVVLIAVVAGAAFYSVSLWQYAGLIGVLLLAGAVVGMLVRGRRMEQHRVAHRAEYDGSVDTRRS